MLLRENFEEWVQFGDYWHIFMQFISCSESTISNRQSHKNLKMNELLNFYVISSTCRLVHDYKRCAIGKTVLEIGEEHYIFCPSAQTNHLFSAI